MARDTLGVGGFSVTTGGGGLAANPSQRTDDSAARSPPGDTMGRGRGHRTAAERAVTREGEASGRRACAHAEAGLGSFPAAGNTHTRGTGLSAPKRAGRVLFVAHEDAFTILKHRAFFSLSPLLGIKCNTSDRRPCVRRRTPPTALRTARTWARGIALRALRVSRVGDSLRRVCASPGSMATARRLFEEERRERASRRFIKTRSLLWGSWCLRSLSALNKVMMNIRQSVSLKRKL